MAQPAARGARGGRVRVVKAPAYGVTAVDNALQIVLMLRERNGAGVGVSEVAARIGTAPSTAHRLLSTLVHRGFAVQDEARLYHLGPVLGTGSSEFVRLDDVIRPHLAALRDRIEETVNAMVLEGTHVRIVLSAETRQAVRVSERTGTTVPASVASVGKALLAQMPRAEVFRMFTGRRARLSGDQLSPAELARLEAELDQVRAEGVGYNLRDTENELVAVGCAVPVRGCAPWLGLSVQVPLVRHAVIRDPLLHGALRAAAEGLAEDLERRGLSGRGGL